MGCCELSLHRFDSLRTLRGKYYGKGGAGHNTDVPDRTESDRLSSDADAEHKLRSRMFPGVFPLQEKDPVYHTGSRTGRLPAVKQRVPVDLEKK